MVVITGEGEKTCASTPENGMKGKGRQVFSHADVHIYFINPNEQGPTKRDTATVRLVMIPFKDQDALSKVVIPPAFLEAGGWCYPLIPSKTPVYRTEEKYYIFPDLSSTSPGLSVGIVFQENMAEVERDLFENILLGLAGLENFPIGFAKKFGNPGKLITNTEKAYALMDSEGFESLATEFPTKAVAGELRAGIMTVAEIAADGITFGANKTLEFIAYETGNDESMLNSNLVTAKEFTGKAVEISSQAVSKLIDVTSKLAEFGSHYVRTATTVAMDTVQDQTQKGTSTLRTGVNYVTDGAMHTMGMVYEALHNAGKTLAHSITHNHVLDHRYGAGNRHIMELGPDALASLTLTPVKTVHSAEVKN